MAKKRLLVLGRSHMELTLPTPRLPEPGQTLLSDGPYGFTGGGKGLISAICAARMDTDCVFCSRVGQDVYGSRLRALLENNGINLRSFLVDKTRPTSLKVRLVYGEQAGSVVYPGASLVLSDDDIEEAFVSYPDVLLLCGDMSLDIMKTAVSFAADDDVPTVLDVPMRAPQLPLHDLGRLRVAVLGEEQIASYTRLRPDSLNEYVHAAIQLSGQINADYFVFNLPRRGIYVTDGKYSEILAPIPGESVDTTAAAETFVTTLACEMARHNKIKTAAAVAQAAQALCAAKTGSYTSIPDRAAVEEFLQRLGA